MSKESTHHIVVKTRLHSGIYADLGGGKTRVVAEFKGGAQSLIKAATLAYEEAKESARCYGGIGAGVTWIEIDGECFRDPFNLHDPVELSKSEFWTRTHAAESILDDLKGRA